MAKDGAGAGTIPDAHDPSKQHAPTMLTTDLALRVDPAYEKISRRFLENPDQFADAFARAWFKLTHRDMGPRARYLGPEVPAEELIWQDPIPAVDHPLIDDAGRRGAEEEDPGLGPVGVRSWSSTAWASASTFRGSDKRGGANGARIRLAPQKDWAVNQPAQLAKVLKALEGIQSEFNARADRRQEGLAGRPDRAGRLRRRRAGGEGRRARRSTVPFTPGRTDASQEQTDVESFAPLEPIADGFRNYSEGQLQRAGRGAADRQGAAADADRAGDDGAGRRPARAGRQRRPDRSTASSPSGPGTLTQRLLRQPARHGHGVEADVDGRATLFEGRDRKTGDVKWTGTRVDLVFGSNAQLRALAEVYGSADAQKKFVDDFVAAWTKVMNLDRFDLG